MKKLILMVLMAGFAALPLACANRDFGSPVSPTMNSNSPSYAAPTPTP